MALACGYVTGSEEIQSEASITSFPVCGGDEEANASQSVSVTTQCARPEQLPALPLFSSQDVPNNLCQY